jgi:organic hydroperoxide reductase OsmC/OhrA
MKAWQHVYRVTVEWTGNRCAGTTTYTGYGRDHLIAAGGKPPIAGSADPAFRGDATRWNPEVLLVAAIATCHQLWHLHLCSAAGISVLSYQDDADGAGRFVGVTLRPQVRIRTHDDAAKAASPHHDAHKYCFIANSVAFPIACEPAITRDN